jgi:hypothetical protein
MTIVESALQSQRVKETISGLHGDDFATCLSVALICGRIIQFEWPTRILAKQEKWRCHNVVKNSIFLLKQCCP